MMNGQNSMPYHKELTSVSTKLVIATKLMQVKEESGVFYFYFLFVWFKPTAEFQMFFFKSHFLFLVF